MGKRISKKEKGILYPKNYLLMEPAYLGDKNIPMSIELIQYDAAKINVKNIPLKTQLKPFIDSTKVNWFNVVGISNATEITRICKEFDLHGFDVKDLLSDQRVVKVVAYDNVTFILMSSFYQESEINNIDDIQIAFILGQNFIVSFQEALIPAFDDVKKNIIDNNALIRQNGTDFLLYILLSAVNLSNINVVTNLEDHLSDIEDQLIAGKTTVNLLQHLHGCKVNYMHLKRSIVSLREEYNNLLYNTNKLIKKENIVYFNNFDDRMRIMESNLASFYESLSSILDLYYNNNNLRMNEIIKRLTIVSTIFIPLTFIVGVWGMNFDFMPELGWKYGYIFAWATIALIALLSYLWMRKQKWF